MIDSSTKHNSFLYKPRSSSRFPCPSAKQLLQEDPDILHMIQRKLVSKKLETLPASPTHVAPPVKINLEAWFPTVQLGGIGWSWFVLGFPSQNLPFPGALLDIFG